MSKRGKSKVKLSASKPELPPFLQRIREQLVANEDADRREQSEKKRKSRPNKTDDPDDAPELVRVGDDNITEEEFERMKQELETKYRLDNKKAKVSDDLDMDYLIKRRENKLKLKPTGSESRPDVGRNKSQTRPAGAASSSTGGAAAVAAAATTTTSRHAPSGASKSTKTLTYGSSSSSEDED